MQWVKANWFKLTVGISLLIIAASTVTYLSLLRREQMLRSCFSEARAKANQAWNDALEKKCKDEEAFRHYTTYECTLSKDTTDAIDEIYKRGYNECISLYPKP